MLLVLTVLELNIFKIGFINFMLKGKTLKDFTHIFPPNNFKNNDDVIFNHLMNNV